MASMVKEKRRGKKKTKEKLPSLEEDESFSKDVAQEDVSGQILVNEIEDVVVVAVEQASSTPKIDQEVENVTKAIEQCVVFKENTPENEDLSSQATCTENISSNKAQQSSTEIDINYKDLNEKLKITAISETSLEIDEEWLENPKSYLQSKNNEMPKESVHSSEVILVDSSVVPSAPMCMEQIEPGAPPEEELIQDELRNKKPKSGMSLDEAIRVYGGKEIAAVKEISEREEADVISGPNCPPDHPLIDLLSTFRTSLKAVERERTRLAAEFAEEEKIRSTLWKVEKQSIHLTEQCKCTLKVDMKATYEHAELMKGRIPAAKLRLQALLKEVQESYCVHQHAAMLAHCQIEDIVSETIKAKKNNIRENLSLILQALRASDGAPDVLPVALQRWAEILAGALIDERDLKQLFFVMHHMFRQTRSVRWAARVIHTRVTDSVTAARTLAVLDILLTKLLLEAATECDEEMEGGWEEMDMRGGLGAVTPGALRERDLLALVRALPLQQLVAKLVLFDHSDFRQATEYDWGDSSGGRGLLKSCCGVRALLAVLQRAVHHRVYTRLHAALRAVACAALTALHALYYTPRAPYLKELEETIIAELHAAFADGFRLFGAEDLEKLPTLLLTDDVAKEYCLIFIMGLHEKSRKKIECLWIEAPVLPCETRLRIITRSAADRVHDHELARIVLDFLLQTGVVRKSAACKLGCESAARECIPQLLTAHPYLRAIALHTVAELVQVETLEPSTVSALQVNKWRPNEQEMQSVLDSWSQRCPTLLQQMLLQLDYTPHSGLDLSVQLQLGRWLCTYSSTGALQLEHAWRVLLKLRTHRSCWRVPCVAPPPDPEPCDLFSMAHALLSSEWGHSIPLICTQGVNVMFTLCATRPREAVHCLAPVMLLMPLSPESISLTPKFAELFTILLTCGPNLVQRALGRGGASGAELLLRLVLSQVELKQPYVFPAWLHALWRVPAALSILDIAALAMRDWFTMDLYANTLIREENGQEHLSNAVRFAFTSPLLCECLLRVAHTQEVSSTLFYSLLAALCKQRAANQRIHVDNALQEINKRITSEELIIYRCGSAAFVAPFQHPSHLTLWRLFLHIYLERPRDIDPRDPAWLPCGPLFYSGLIKSRTLAQIKKRLLETATFHHNEAESYKTEPQSIPPKNRVSRSASIVNDYPNLLPSLKITDLTDESLSDYEDSDSDGETGSQNFEIDGSTEEAMDVEKKRNDMLASYHSGAEKMMRDYARWLDEGEKVQAFPPNADIARYILPQALEEAWNQTLSRCRPPPNPELDTFIRPEPPPPFNYDTRKTPLQTAISTILTIKCRSPISESYRSLRTIRSRVDVLNKTAFGDVHKVLTRVTELLTDLEKYSEEWDREVTRISSQDSKLWECVCALRVPRPLPPVKKQCANKCQPITFYLNMQEWCISAGAERGVRECRAASLAGIRRLATARPQIVRIAAGLHNIARRIRNEADAGKVLELTWRCAETMKPCHAATSAIILLFDTLVEKWVRQHKELCNQLLQRGCEYNSSKLQQYLCGSLVSPRSMDYADWPDIYITLLECSLPPHNVFSYLSRFDVKKWSEHIDDHQQHRVLNAIICAVIARPTEGDSEAMLQELLGVHTTLLMTARMVMWTTMESTKHSVTGMMPINYWKHLIIAADRHARECSFEEIGTILTGIGGMWCSSDREECERHATYAPTTSELIHILTREYVSAALDLTFTPERVATVVWSVMVASFSPWIHPRSILPEPTRSPQYVNTLCQFVTSTIEIMKGCPGSEEAVLQYAYTSTVAMYETTHKFEPPINQQLTAWLDQMTRLPWAEYQWFTVSYIQTLMQVMRCGVEELSIWACARITATEAATLLDGSHMRHIDKHLCNCLKLFAGWQYVNDVGFLNTAAQLPWWELKETSLKKGMTLFFTTHFNSNVPYHETPQANVMLNAAELNSALKISVNAHAKRKVLVTTWTQMYKDPPLAGHSACYTKFMLERITFMAPYTKSEQEKVELLQALAAMLEWGDRRYIGAVLEVWLSWLLDVPLYILAPVVAVSGDLSVTEYTAPLADNSIRLFLLLLDNHWYMIKTLWIRHVQTPAQYIEQGALYAAYASAILSRDNPIKPYTMFTKLQALIDNNRIDYEKNEGIVALWICYLLRLVTECDDEINKAKQIIEARESQDISDSTVSTESGSRATSSNTPNRALVLQIEKYVRLPARKVRQHDRFGSTIEERKRSKQAALNILACWGQLQRRSLLKVVTLQADTERPTARLRALVRLVDCIVRPCSDTAQAYQAAITALSGNYSDVITLGNEPSANKLVRLASRLLPSVPDRYFLYEMRFCNTDELAP